MGYRLPRTGDIRKFKPEYVLQPPIYSPTALMSNIQFIEFEKQYRFMNGLFINP